MSRANQEARKRLLVYNILEEREKFALAALLEICAACLRIRQTSGAAFGRPMSARH
jgi:hypothetical protein